MGYRSRIVGTIKGISEDSFELIREDLEDVFDGVVWEDNALDVDSYDRHLCDWVYPIYDKIAFCIDEGGSGELYYEGDDNTDMSMIYFAPREWEELLVDMIYPDNPFEKKSAKLSERWKTFEIYFFNLMPDIQIEILKLFGTTVDAENWRTKPITVIHREVKDVEHTDS